MNKILSALVIIFGLLTLNSSWALPLPHLDLDMSSQEYEKLLKSSAQNTKSKRENPDDPAISFALLLGRRLSAWIEIINAKRSPDNAIRLTSKETRQGTPIEKPNKYSIPLIKEETSALLKAMPQEMRDALLGPGSLPDSISVPDEVFILHGRRLDKNYQSAARYKLVNPSRIFYTGRARNDVRGYYYLTKNNITADELRDIATIPEEKLPLIKDALLKICINYSSFVLGCEEELAEAVKNNGLSTFYQTYYPAGKKNWDAFFKIPDFARRKDLTWEDNTLKVPFNTPLLGAHTSYLQNNVEEEFRFKDWFLKIEFGLFPQGPRLMFRPDVVPHVNGLGGNIITMNSNQSIEEYESQWIIRHEFGHVLGLPDCYHEFFDVKEDAFVSYQLDITDLMCSRAGDMNERIFLELKRAYHQH